MWSGQVVAAPPASRSVANGLVGAVVTDMYGEAVDSRDDSVIDRKLEEPLKLLAADSGGAALEEAQVQTVERQSPARGGRSSSVTVWLNPFCRREAACGPELKEPLVTPGPTELVSGFFLVGGPPDRRFSDPGCKLPIPAPGAGTVEVTNTSGAVVATQTSTSGHFVEIPLPAGSYTITGTFLGATVNDVHPRESEAVVIPPGHTVRQDFFLNIP
jgi:hypothetical protein